MNRALAVVPVLALLLVARPAPACSCGGKPTVDEAYRRSSVVALVRVSRVVDQWTLWRRIKDRFRATSELGFENYYRDYGFRITVQVLQQWKGAPSRSLEIVTGRGGGDCGYLFQVGQTYLVYSGLGLLGVTICGRTMSGQDAGPDAQVLDRLVHSR